MNIQFSKYQGSGNDFILIDNRARFFPHGDTSLISRMCHRRYGIGADGLILLESSLKADFRMRIFNADGTEASMCGNGLRCLVQFIKESDLYTGSLHIETMADVMYCLAEKDSITLHMPRPELVQKNVAIEIMGKNFAVSVARVGVPHAVIFCDDIYAVNIDAIGPKIRHHLSFSPEGVNVNFACLRKDGTLEIRTYERGVEAETLSCGTGAVAASYCAMQGGQISYPIRVLPLSKEELEVGSSIQDRVYLKGKASLSFTGSMPFTHQ